MPEPNGRNWCDGLPEHIFKWYRQHPEWEGENPVFALARVRIIEQGKKNIAIQGVGVISCVYREGIGVCTSETDKSCPFFDKENHLCKIWDTDYLPNYCKITPQNLTDEEKIEKWSNNHPSCGFYWVDE